MKILWTHNFDPAIPNGLVFINTAVEGLQSRGIAVTVEYLGNLRSVANLNRVRAKLKDISTDFDIVHAHYGSACALVTATIKNIPKVLSIRGNDWNVHSESLGFHYWHTRLARFMTTRAISKYDCVLTVSRNLASDVSSKFPTSWVETIASPIDLNRFVPLDKTVARKLLGYSDCDERWILFNSQRLDDPVKRYALALDAFNLANSRVGNLRLQIATNLPHERLPLFVAACDLILCTSETEGWPNSIKEALACNVPFVSTDVSDLGEIAQQEHSCRICSPTANALAAGISDVLATSKPPDLRKYVSGMGVDVSTDRLVAIYESLRCRTRRGRRLSTTCWA